MTQSTADLQQAQLLNLQLQAQQSGVATQPQYKQGQVANSHPWSCGPYPCT